MIKVIQVVLPVFLVIGLGIGLRRIGLFSKSDGETLSKVAYYVALPALLFYSVATIQTGENNFWVALIGVIGAYLLTTLICIGVIKFKKIPNPVATSIIINAANGNHAYVGLPLLGFAYGNEGMIIGAFLSGMLGIWMSILTIIVERLFNNSGDKLKGWSLFRSAIGSLLRNPVFLCVMLGLFYNLLKIELPLFLERGLLLLGQAAAMLGLLAIGLNINWNNFGHRVGSLVYTVIIRLVGTSAFAWGLFQVLPVNITTARVGTLLLATPCGVVSFVIVKELGGDQELAATTIFLSTLLSPLTMGLFLYFLGV